MASKADIPTTLVTLLETQGPCTNPLDAAIEYIRVRAGRLVPLYVVAMVPFSVGTLLLIDAITSEIRSRVPACCLLLLAATVWRWVWIARLQQRVQEDLQGTSSTRFRQRLGPILLLRLYGHVATGWGSLLAGVPAFYGLFVGSFAAPLLLENGEPVLRRLTQVLAWIHHSAWRLGKMLLVMTLLAALLAVSLFVNQAILGHLILPSLLGVDTTDLNLTLDSWAWRLSALYFIFMLLDGFWAVASVIVYYDSQSRRMATDLRVRLQAVMEGLP